MASLNAPQRQALVDQVIRYESNNKQYECLVCHIKMPGEASATDHLKSKPHRAEGARKAVMNLLKSKKNPPSLQQLLPSAIKVAVNEGMVSVTAKDYKCNRCNVTSNGIIPLEDHLKSPDHMKAKGGRQPVPNASKPPTSTPKVPIIMSHTQQLSRNYFAASNLNQNHNRPQPSFSGDMAGASALLEVAADEMYSVNSNPRGHVYVFNYSFRGTESPRNGAEHDTVNIQNTFTKMGYDVFPFLDLTKDATYAEFERIRRKPELERIDAFIMCLLSHGLDPDTFYSSDKEEMSLSHIQRMFMDGNCPHLRGKPRIFFANYCRGSELQKKDRFEYDSVEAPKNIAIVHAATEGIRALRSKSSGTIFIDSLCEVLRQHARHKDLHSIYLKTNDKMQEKGGTRPMWTNYCFKRFYFNPVQY